MYAFMSARTAKSVRLNERACANRGSAVRERRELTFDEYTHKARVTLAKVKERKKRKHVQKSPSNDA